MSDITIKLIEEDTEIPELKPYEWDVVVKGRPFYVARIPGFVHTIKGWGEPIDLWAWPRDEKASYENLVEYDLDSPVAWGLEYREQRYIRSKWDDVMLRSGAVTTITRNGIPFYDVFGGRNYSVPKAIVLIGEIGEHPLDFNTIGFDEKMIGRKIWFRSQPGIITRYIKGQCCVMVAPDGIDHFKRPPEYENDDLFDDWYDEQELKLDCLADHNIDWFRG